MKEQEQLDGFLQKKLEAREFPFQEAYWQAAEQLIVADEGRRRRRFLVWLNLMGFVLTGLMLGATVWQTALPTGELGKSQPVSTSVPPVEYPETGVHVPLANLVKRTDLPSGTSPATVLVPSQGRRTGPIQDQAPHSFTEMASREVPFEGAAAGARGDIPNPVKTSEAKENTFVQQNSPHRKGLGVGLGPQLTPENQLTKTNAKTLSSSNIRIVRINASLPIVNLSGQSSLSIDRFPRPGLRGRHKICLSAGLAFAQTWTEAELPEKGLLADPVMGIQYRYLMGRGLQFRAGLQYQLRSGLNVSHSYTSTEYSFGIEQETTTILPQRLHFVEVPVGFAIPFTGRHSILIGADFSYLINVYSDLQRQQQDSFSEATSTVEQAWGYKQGFAPWNLGLNAGYEYTLSRGFRAGLQLHYGLHDLTDNEFFNKEALNRNVQLRLSLNYDLFSF